MSELEICESLERMVKAAEADDPEGVGGINGEFSRLIWNQYGHLPNWSMNEDNLKYDAVRNKAGEIVTGWIDREEGLKAMRELFLKIEKPSK